jgi:hypothetical protein
MSTPRFLADEDLNRVVVLATRRLEPTLDFATVPELGLAGTADADVLAFAAAEGRLLVSHDVNTMRAAAEARVRAGAPMPGLFLVPQDRPVRAVADSLVLIWGATAAEDWRDQIVYLPLP